METEIETLVSRDSNRQSQIGSELLFERKIEFHMARKPFSGVVNFDKSFQLETLNPTVPNGNNVKETDSMTLFAPKKSEGLNFGRNGFDPELSFGITFRRIGAGLENLGNTCFLNSVLQCLTYTEPLVAYLQSGRHQSSCQIAGFCALCAIQKHVSRALHATGRSLAPKDLVSNLRCISRTFRNARQEDAHEYMVHLLESMHKCCLPKGVPSESPSAYEKSLVHKIFGGRLQSQVRCMQCSYCSNKYDPFLDLSLEIAKADTLQKALGHFTAKEQLDGGAKQYQCQKCKQKVRAVKQLTIHDAPYVLTIHLKRFCAHDPRQKIDKKVVFSPTLDLKPFVSGSHEGSLMYTLYGVLVHAGWNTRSGHYYCFVRTSTGMWYNLDDNRVVQVNERAVLEQKAYMLFYVRDRKKSPPKKPCNVTLNERMGSHANGKNIPLSLTKDLKGMGQNGSLEKHVDKEKSVTATKDAISVKEPVGTDCTTATNNEAMKITPSESVVLSLPIGTDIVSRSEVMESLPPSQSCNNTEGSIGISTVASNNEKVVNEDVSISSNKPPNCSSVQCPENRKSVITDKSQLMIGDGCSLGVRGSSDCLKEDPDSKTGLIVSADQIVTLPVSSKTNDKVEVLECNAMNKPSRRLVKPVIVTMRLSTVVMCKSSARLCKKKHKRSRQTIFKNQNMETAESISGTVSVAPPSRQRKRKSPSKEKPLDPKNKKLASINTPLKNIISECRTKSDRSVAVLEANKTVKCKLSNQIKSDDATKNCIHSGAEKVSSLPSGLKRGLEEPIVARWDGTLSSNDIISITSESTRIGYVPDEWDEEYDRGKKKKVKMSKDLFDGRNPFQELSATKASKKTLKRDRSSSGNLPYRIP